MTYSPKDVLEATSHLTGVTIPVHIELESEQVVLSQHEMQEILSHAKTIAIGNCICREGERSCEHLVKSCLALDEEAETKVAEDGWKKIDLKAAMELLETTYKQGLVHMAYRRASVEGGAVRESDLGFVCSCCSCCCGPLNGLRQFKYSDAITRSAYRAQLDEEACVGCGTCVKRCLFGAYSLPEGSRTARLDVDRCFGCGLCVETCSVGAIAFVER